MPSFHNNCFSPLFFTKLNSFLKTLFSFWSLQLVTYVHVNIIALFTDMAGLYQGGFKGFK